MAELALIANMSIAAWRIANPQRDSQYAVDEVFQTLRISGLRGELFGRHIPDTICAYYRKDRYEMNENFRELWEEISSQFKSTNISQINRRRSVGGLDVTNK